MHVSHSPQIVVVLVSIYVSTCSLVSFHTVFGGFALTDDPVFVPTAPGITIALECLVLESQPPPIIQWFNTMNTQLTDSGSDIQLLEDSRFLYLRGVYNFPSEYHCEVTNAWIHERISGTRYQIDGTGLVDGETHVYKEIGSRTAFVGELNFVFSYVAVNGLVNQDCQFHLDHYPVPGVLGVATVTFLLTLSSSGNTHSLTCQQDNSIIGNPGTLTLYGESILRSDPGLVFISPT